MGREIRRVPPDWKHPIRECPHYPKCTQPYKNNGRCFQPLHDQSFVSAAAEWKKEYSDWENGKHPSKSDFQNCEFWEYHGDPPDRAYYRDRDWTEEEASCFQLYSTVSEGTPMSPVCATKDELFKYLTTHGDYWDSTPWKEDAAKRMIESGWAPSMIVTRSEKSFTIQTPRDMR